MTIGAWAGRGAVPPERRCMDWRGELARLFRFGLVGLAATASYLVTAIALPLQSWSPIDPTEAALMASIISVTVSYFGHHRITFRQLGDHGFFLPRFVFVSVML